MKRVRNCVNSADAMLEFESGHLVKVTDLSIELTNAPSYLFQLFGSPVYAALRCLYALIFFA